MNKKVAVVEEDEAVRQHLVRGLIRLGYRAVGYANTAELTTGCAREKPDILICDANTPACDGVEKVRSCMTDCGHCLCILTSADPPEPAAASGDGIPEDVIFLSKPFKARQAADLIQAFATRDNPQGEAIPPK